MPDCHSPALVERRPDILPVYCFHLVRHLDLGFRVRMQRPQALLFNVLSLGMAVLELKVR